MNNISQNRITEIEHKLEKLPHGTLTYKIINGIRQIEEKQYASELIRKNKVLWLGL